MIKTVLSTWMLLTSVASVAQVPERQLMASRTHELIRIDGELKEADWAMASVATHFVQNSPVPGRPEVHPTEVRVLYGDAALYIGATLYDHADSILRQFDRRDHTSNTDFFGVFLDTYHDKLNGYGFLVTAAGVQVDMRYSSNGQDGNWNAVWDSEVKIIADHWVVEMRIPYSAIRFSNQNPQVWGVNFMRQLKRNNESFFWNPVDPSVRGFLNQFGELHGLENIQSQLRLSQTHYVTTNVEKQQSKRSKNKKKKKKKNRKKKKKNKTTIKRILKPPLLLLFIAIR